MITVLADHNIEGQAITLWGVMSAEGWLELLPLRLVTFAQTGLSAESSDREVWRFSQENKMILLTSNRRMGEADALGADYPKRENHDLPHVSFEIVGKIQDIETIARGRGVDLRQYLNYTYGRGNWRKLKGKALVQYPDGRIVYAEIHWFEAHGIGKVMMKIVRHLRETR